MTYSLEWRNEAKTILAKVDGNHTDIIEPGHPEWAELSQAEGIVAFVTHTVDLGEEVRSQRNALLSASDWTQVADAPVDKTAWAAYRQELRDITEQVGFPTEVIWPTKPA
jgi:hypothetical protein